MPAHPKAIGWDLHHTLVGFAPTARDRFALIPQADQTLALELRPGMAAALTRLSERGYLHYVTTTATHDHAESVLQATGIRGHIAGIFSGLEVDVGLGKLYRPLAAALGLSDAEAAQRLLVVGDLIYDQPADIDGLVFILQPDGVRHDAATVAGMILQLEDAAAGDIGVGFSALYSGARQMGRTLPRLGGGYLLPVTPGTTAYLETRRPLWQGQRAGLEATSVPTILMLTNEAIAYYRGETE